MRYILALMMICFTTLAFAGASGEIVKIEFDDTYNIRVWVQYKVDGVEVPSRYPPINGKQVWCFRKNFSDFVGMTNTDIINNIKGDIEDHCDKLVIGEFKEIENTSKAIYKAIGQNPTVFRPPYGATSNQVRSVLSIPTILWSIDTLDWKHRNADKILSYVKASAKDGSIILMHDIHQSTANGLENVILYLQKQGYELVTVSEILQ